MRCPFSVGLALALLTLGCDDGGGSSSGQGGAGGDGVASSGSPASTGNGPSGASTSTGTGTGAQTTATGASTGTGMDPYEAARQACIDKINELRATKGLPPYARWTAGESCADRQATSDEMSGQAHGSFGDCQENAQNECLGAGPNGIEGCLESMWAEKDQAGCSGCDACNMAYNPNCPNCDFYGTMTGDVCGHYVNMSALYFAEAACGFSSLGGWDVINFG